MLVQQQREGRELSINGRCQLIRWAILSGALSMGSVESPLADSNHAASYSRIGVGARAMAMGGAYVAVADDPTATMWNPARMMRVRGLALTYMRSVGMKFDRYHEFLGFAKSWRSVAIGFGMQRAGWNGFESRNGVDGNNGDFGIVDYLLLPSVAFQFGPVGLGLSSPKIFIQEIDGESESGSGADLGAFLDLGRWVDLGFAVQDVHSEIGDDELPYNLRAGICVNPLGHLYDPVVSALLATDLEKTEDDETVYHVGAEIGLHLPRGFHWALRVGISDIGRDHRENRYSIGGGLRVERLYWLGFDYAYIDESDASFGASHRLSVNWGRQA
ncbi:MAG: hypothetical protein ABIK65_15710 [Candidatus Eisenbacteria bacterium]